VNRKEIKDRYDQLGGKIYNLRYKYEQLSKYNKIFTRLRLSTDSLILDDGCGTGLLMEKLKGYIVGVDISSKLLKNAVNRITEDKHIIQGDSESLPFRTNIFDIVFSLTVIQNLDDPDRAIVEIRRVSKKSSQIYISILKKASEKKDFFRLLKKNGFKEINILDDESLKDWIALIYR